MTEHSDKDDEELQAARLAILKGEATEQTVIDLATRICNYSGFQDTRGKAKEVIRFLIGLVQPVSSRSDRGSKCPDCKGTGKCNCEQCKGACAICGGTGYDPFSGDSDGTSPPMPGPERDRYIHQHDCPRIWDFWKKYALGSKLCPSCLLCGHQAHDPADWSIRHAELPDIYICKACVDKARTPSATASGIPMDTARLDYVLNHSDTVDRIDMRMWDTEADFLKAAREGIDAAMGFPTPPEEKERFTPTHQHAEGGLYQIIGKFVKVKTGKDSWVVGVRYRNAEGAEFIRTLVEFDERMTALPSPPLFGKGKP